MTTLTIAQAAEATGLSSDTLRYYERGGLLRRPVPRNRAGYRVYNEDDVAWIRIVMRLRATGMPIRALRRYAELAREGDGSRPLRLAMLQDHRRRVLERQAEITEHLRAIDAKIADYAACVPSAV